MNIIVTGGSRGIGQATALVAGERKWNIGINFVKNADAAQAVANDVQNAGGQGLPIQGDASIEDDVKEIFDVFETKFGPVSGVVINAGVTALASQLKDFETDRLRKVLDTNVLGAYLCAREAARRMTGSKAENKSIVFVGSVASRLGSPNEYVDYAGSKGAVDTLTLGLSKELGPHGIRVNCVRPGIIRTDIHASHGDVTRVDRLGNMCPLGRPGEASEVAEAIVWLLSDKASYVTGALLDVSGGR